MGMDFVVRTKHSSYGRTVMRRSHRPAILFFEIARLLEEKLEQPCGLIDYSQEDEYGVDPTQFISFLERFMEFVWDGEGVEYLYNWAEHAAGMVENITLEPRFWKNRHGPALFTIRYILHEKELETELSRKKEEFEKRQKKLPAQPHPAYSELQIEDYVDIINNAILRASQ